MIGLAIFLLSCGVYGKDEKMFSDDDFNIPLWDCSTELRGGFGYRDNVLLSHTNAQGSAFWMSGAEVMIFRLPTRGWQFHFFADASDIRYFNSPSVDNEQVALAAAQLAKDFGDGWKSALGVNYLFQNQVFDFSNTYTNQGSVGQVLGHTLAPRWWLRKTVGAFWLEGEVGATRQWLDEPLDNYWEFGPKGMAGWSWGHGSELVISYQYRRLDYDTRERVDALGQSIPRTALALDSHAAGLSFTKVWDEKNHWQTVTALDYESSLDNGSGFFDYDRYRLSQQVRYRNDRWEISARVKLSYFAYSVQTVSATDTASRRKTMCNVAFRVERKLTKHLKAAASYNWDRSISNLDFDDYAANSFMGGLALTF